MRLFSKILNFILTKKMNNASSISNSKENSKLLNFRHQTQNSVSNGNRGEAGSKIIKKIKGFFGLVGGESESARISMTNSFIERPISSPINNYKSLFNLEFKKSFKLRKYILINYESFEGLHDRKFSMHGLRNGNFVICFLRSSNLNFLIFNTVKNAIHNRIELEHNVNNFQWSARNERIALLRGYKPMFSLLDENVEFLKNDFLPNETIISIEIGLNSNFYFLKMVNSFDYNCKLNDLYSLQEFNENLCLINESRFQDSRISSMKLFSDKVAFFDEESLFITIRDLKTMQKVSKFRIPSKHFVIIKDHIFIIDQKQCLLVCFDLYGNVTNKQSLSNQFGTGNNLILVDSNCESNVAIFCLNKLVLYLSVF